MRSDATKRSVLLLACLASIAVTVESGFLGNVGKCFGNECKVNDHDEPSSSSHSSGSSHSGSGKKGLKTVLRLATLGSSGKLIFEFESLAKQHRDVNRYIDVGHKHDHHHHHTNDHHHSQTVDQTKRHDGHDHKDIDKHEHGTHKHHHHEHEHHHDHSQGGEMAEALGEAVETILSSETLNEDEKTSILDNIVASIMNNKNGLSEAKRQALLNELEDETNDHHEEDSEAAMALARQLVVDAMKSSVPSDLDEHIGQVVSKFLESKLTKSIKGDVVEDLKSLVGKSTLIEEAQRQGLLDVIERVASSPEHSDDLSKTRKHEHRQTLSRVMNREAFELLENKPEDSLTEDQISEGVQEMLKASIHGSEIDSPEDKHAAVDALHIALHRSRFEDSKNPNIIDLHSSMHNYLLADHNNDVPIEHHANHNQDELARLT